MKRKTTRFALGRPGKRKSPGTAPCVSAASEANAAVPSPMPLFNKNDRRDCNCSVSANKFDSSAFIIRGSW